MTFTEENSDTFLSPISHLLFAGAGYRGKKWQMTLQERMAIIHLLRWQKPSVAIEVGTSRGGALDIIAHHAGTVYSLDIDASVRERLAGEHPEVQFVTGDSNQTLPPLLADLKARGQAPDFILLDGGHTTEALAGDIAAVLASRPENLVLVMHDSFNPPCREAIVQAEWDSCPALSYLEVDFVSGIVHNRADIGNSMWGGLSLALFGKQTTCGTTVKNCGYQYQFDALKERFQ